MRLGAAEFLRQQYLAGNLGMQENSATGGLAQGPGDQPEPRFPGSRGAGIIQSELRICAAQHALYPDGRLEGAFRERARGSPADLQVVDAWPAAAQAGAVFAGEVAPGPVSHDDPTVTIQQPDPFGQRGAGT